MTRVPADPIPAAKAAIVALLADETPAPRIATRKWPADWSLADGQPLVLIADDGGPIDWPVLGRHTIRVTVGSGDAVTSGRIARKCIGHLLDSVPAGLADIRGGTGVIETQHTKTGADLASATVSAAVRTEEI